MAVMKVALVIISLLLNDVSAQIPKKCFEGKTDNSNLECCPMYNHVQCGGTIRGQCVAVTESNAGWKANYVRTDAVDTLQDYFDERFNWPTGFFTRVCHCKGNYAGVDCGDCKFGFEGTDCKTKSTRRIRKSAAKMSDQEWAKYNMKLKRAKTVLSSYLIYTGNDPRSLESFSEVSLYELAVWMHHYAARSDQRPLLDESAYNYAHGSLGFLTWHRLYLLWFEREMEVLFDEPFTIPYWNWMETSDRMSLFVPNKLGSIDDDGNVTGEFYGDSWKPVCLYDPSLEDTRFKAKCDPVQESIVHDRLTRCTDASLCEQDNAKWPRKDKTVTAIRTLSEYRVLSSNEPIFNKENMDSFSNYLEGWDTNFTERHFCVSPSPDNEVFCGTDGIPRRLHNTVHLLVRGTMANVPGSANDPLFLNHHATIDCLFQRWIERYPNAKYPNRNLPARFAGHGLHDLLVPFLPVYTNADMFETSENMGYNCDLSSAKRNVITGVMVAVAVIIACLVA